MTFITEYGSLRSLSDIWTFISNRKITCLTCLHFHFQSESLDSVLLFFEEYRPASDKFRVSGEQEDSK